MSKYLVAGVLVLVSAGLLSGAALAQTQDKSTIYVYVGWWDVPREKWPAFVALYEKHEWPVMERLFEEGVLLEYGLDSNGLHSPDDYTHSTWMVATSLANIERAFEAYSESLGADAGRIEAEFAAMVTKHGDGTYYSDHHGSRPAKLSKGYFQGNMVRVKRGKSADYTKLWEARMQPVYERLLADGTIVAYGLDTPYHHTTENSLGLMVSWYILENMDDDAKVDAAFEAARSALTESERTAQRELVWAMTVEDSHRDVFSRLIRFRSQ